METRARDCRCREMCPRIVPHHMMCTASTRGWEDALDTADREPADLLCKEEVNNNVAGGGAARGALADN